MDDASNVKTDASRDAAPRDHHVCPVWIGHLLASPLRRLVENPRTILSPHVTPGSIAVDVGCAMGFFSFELARLVGSTGRVICLDVQQKMLDGLVRRARRKGLADVVEPRLCSQDGLGLEDLAGKADLVLAFHVVHETSHPERFLRDCADALRTGGRMLVAEPRGHVAESDFQQVIAAAGELGLAQLSEGVARKSHSAVLEKR